MDWEEILLDKTQTAVWYRRETVSCCGVGRSVYFIFINNHMINTMGLKRAIVSTGTLLSYSVLCALTKGRRNPGTLKSPWTDQTLWCQSAKHKVTENSWLLYQTNKTEEELINCRWADGLVSSLVSSLSGLYVLLVSSSSLILVISSQSIY